MFAGTNEVGLTATHTVKRMYRYLILFSLSSFGCWSDAKPDKATKKRVVISFQMPEQDGRWIDGVRHPDGTIGRFRKPPTPSSSKLIWGSQYEITTQQRWNGMKGMYQTYFVSLDGSEDRSGQKYELVGIEPAHIAVFDSKSGKGRFSNQRNRCSASEEKSSTHKNSQIERCGLRFIAEGKTIAQIQSLIESGEKATLVMQHAKRPNRDRVVSLQ